MNIKQILRSVADVVLPRNCSVCGRPLDVDEHYLCRTCLSHLPRTNLHTLPFNTMEQLFAGQVPVEHASGFIYYEKASNYAQILHDIKYRNMPKMGQFLARMAATEVVPTGWWTDVDTVVPVPLHIDKLVSRGYNQSAYIGQGLAEVLNVPVVDALEATHAHATQTRKTRHERSVNAQGLYLLKPEYVTSFRGKHILLVDDVVTTGATLLACAKQLKAVEGVRVSVYTLAVARLD